MEDDGCPICATCNCAYPCPCCESGGMDKCVMTREQLCQLEKLVCAQPSLLRKLDQIGAPVTEAMMQHVAMYFDADVSENVWLSPPRKITTKLLLNFVTATPPVENCLLTVNNFYGERHLMDGVTAEDWRLIYSHAIKTDAKRFHLVPEEMRTYELCQMAVELDATNIFHMPKTAILENPDKSGVILLMVAIPTRPQVIMSLSKEVLTWLRDEVWQSSEGPPKSVKDELRRAIRNNGDLLIKVCLDAVGEDVMREQAVVGEDGNPVVDPETGDQVMESVVAYRKTKQVMNQEWLNFVSSDD